ncbi:MAG: extradiol dioxygenase [Ignavibacteriae bacterium]|nr:extradiol dioxygenase [Ignavibacteriota bacterium]MCB9215306.1 extradiol dioxygenase [Ignavibacteria bacterium]
MINELWINLPVSDIDRSKAFFKAIGFSLHPSHAESSEMVGLVIGVRKTMVMLFPDSTFKSFANHEITDAQTTTEVLISFDVEKREDVDELALKVVDAGGRTFGGPAEREGIYGLGFIDPDGHRWNAIHINSR